MEVLVGAEDSPVGRNAVEWAARRAAGLGLRLNIVRVVPGGWMYRDASACREVMASASDLLQAESSRISALIPRLEIRTTRCTGETPEVLGLLSDMAETLVVGSDRAPDSHGEGFGPISFEVTVCSHCPVAVVPARAVPGSSGVTVGVDGSEDSMVALDLAGAEALRMGEDLTVLYVQPVPVDTVPARKVTHMGGETTQGGQILAASARVIRERYPDVTLHEIRETGDPAELLVRAAARARLLVIGCRGGGSARKPVGVVAANVLQHLPCTTIVTRPAPIS